MLWRRAYRGEKVWAVARSEAAQLWDMIGVTPHRPLPVSPWDPLACPEDDPNQAVASLRPPTELPGLVSSPVLLRAKVTEVIDLCSSDSDTEGTPGRALPSPVMASAPAIAAV